MRSDRRVLWIVLAGGPVCWVLDALSDWLFFYGGGFWDLLVLRVPPHELYVRLSGIVVFTIAGVMAARVVRARLLDQRRLRHLNAVLRAIRNINQLIVQTNDRDELLAGACRCLTETLGYEKAWVFLLDERRRPTRFHAAGSERLRAVLADCVERGVLPACAQAALENREGPVAVDPVRFCRSCPLGSEYAGRRTMVGVLGSGSEGCGVLLVALARSFAEDQAEQELFAELLQDLSHGLQSIEESRRRTEAEAALRYRHDLEAVLMRISNSLVNVAPDDLDRRIDEALRVLGEFADVDRSYIFQFHDELDRMSNTHEWCRKGIESHRDQLQDLPVRDYPSVRDVLAHGRELSIRNVSDLPEGRADRRQFEAEGIQSLLVVPMVCDGVLVGFFGLDAVRAPKSWSEETVDLLRTGGEALAGAIQRKRIQRELQTVNEDLEQKVRDRTRELATLNEELESFSYSVSHDLRAPLRAVDGFSAALVEDYGHRLDPGAHSHIERVRGAVRTMNALIDGLLDLSRVSRRELESEPIELAAMAERVVALLREGEPERRVEFTTSGKVWVRGDPVLVRVALENLLGNAWKFTRDASQARIAFCAAAQGSVTTISICDNGVGFDMDRADRLFGPFERLHPAHQFEGCGIGLATVRRIVQRHGGRIWAHSAPGWGSSFHFTLPSAVGPARRAEAVLEEAR